MSISKGRSTLELDHIEGEISGIWAKFIAGKDRKNDFERLYRENFPDVYREVGKLLKNGAWGRSCLELCRGNTGWQFTGGNFRRVNSRAPCYANNRARTIVGDSALS